MISKPIEKSHPKDYLHLLLLIVAILSVGIYFLLRNQGWWSENDTASFTEMARIMLAEKQLIPEKGLYSNGYGYPMLIGIISSLSQLDIRLIQLLISPLLVIVILLPAWLTYREFTGAGKVATLSVVILLIQPEFLFPLFRGTHEKITRLLMFLCLYLLLRSLRSRKNLRLFTAFLVAFYLSTYALITFNNLIAISFIVGVALALLLIWMINLRSRGSTSQAGRPVERLLLVVGSAIVIAFLFTFYAYPPAQEQLRLMNSVQDRVSALVLQVEDSSTNPYAVINSGWINTPVYLAVSLSNWILLVVSALIWLSQSYRWLVRGQRPDGQQILLWAFYGAFALQGALSILVDFSGAIAANLQHRVFPSFAMLGAPLIANWLMIRKPSHKPAGKWLWAAAAGFILLLALLSTFKATLEPLLSNYWIFYRPSERIALEWGFANNQSAVIWSDFNERLTTAYGLWNGAPPNDNRHDSFVPDPGTSNFLVTQVNRLRSERLAVPLPIQADSLRIYDNGAAEIYHKRPVTPYQR